MSHFKHSPSSSTHCQRSILCSARSTSTSSCVSPCTSTLLPLCQASTTASDPKLNTDATSAVGRPAVAVAAELAEVLLRAVRGSLPSPAVRVPVPWPDVERGVPGLLPCVRRPCKQVTRAAATALQTSNRHKDKMCAALTTYCVHCRSSHLPWFC
jgi:hypothetical protein